MKLKNIVIVVKDIESSKQFYKELFGLDVILDQEGNAILTEGLVLQESKVWEETLGQKVVWKNHASELYFEETDLELFLEKLQQYEQKIQYVYLPEEGESKKRAVRLYDLDGNMIEVGEVSWQRV
ncbi:MAG: VOC family protein [Lachnospiraceae bacterium]|jgi:catechol 2,3-dioxygenase-like lactoylglutathione lyase family enzyme